ncbi:MAG: hypothetical protein ABIS45_13050 [Burkholderiales bacterium]
MNADENPMQTNDREKTQDQRIRDRSIRKSRGFSFFYRRVRFGLAFIGVHLRSSAFIGGSIGLKY